MTSCSKKEQNEIAPSSRQQRSTSRIAPQYLPIDVQVSPYGFLVLDDSAAISGYTDFIYDNTASDIAAFHTAIGFVCQTSVTGQADNEIPASIENGEYLFNQDGIVQVGSMIIRGVNDSGYLLAMPVVNLNATNYQKLTTKTFDPSVMVKLKIAAEYMPDLETFVNTHPGYDGTNDPTAPTGDRRFWGWKHEWGAPDEHMNVEVWDAYYICWIRIKTRNHGVEYGGA